MFEPFQIVDVSDWTIESVEPGGSEPNLWLSHDASDRFLYKPVVEKDGRRQGEDWAEKLVEQLAGLLTIPAAAVDMASRAGRSGVLCADLASADGWEMHDGAVLVGLIDRRLVPRAKNRLGHNLRNIYRVLSPLAASGEGLDGLSAFDQFCGYLLLDAWVANADRHESNWGVLRSPDGELSLAPSYDHGNSLGFNLTDPKRSAVLNRPEGIAKWASRGRAVRFEDRRNTTLVAFVAEAFALASTGVRDLWLGRLAGVADAACEQVIGRTPIMSEVSRTFCLRLLQTNKRRLLDGD